jgi:hypothetical protein
VRSHDSNPWFKKPGGDLGVMDYKGNGSVSDWLHRGDGGVSGEGNGGRTTKTVGVGTLVGVPEGLCSAVHHGFGQFFATWPAPVFQNETSHWLLRQPVSLKARADDEC